MSDQSHRHSVPLRGISIRFVVLQHIPCEELSSRISSVSELISLVSEPSSYMLSVSAKVSARSCSRSLISWLEDRRKDLLLGVTSDIIISFDEQVK